MIIDSLILFFAGIAGGILNSLAGGGSFITFPALLLVGVPPVMANATNTFASCAGYMSGAYAFRREIASDRNSVVKVLLLSFLGGVAGAILLLNTPENVFLQAIPWLLLFATLLFLTGGKLNQLLNSVSGKYSQGSRFIGMLLSALLLLVSAYGGFFNAGLGIVSLSYLALAGYSDINLMNGIKLLISTSVSVTAIVVFCIQDVIDWYAGFVVMVGALIGGYGAAHISRQVSQQRIRQLVLLISVTTTIYFFWDVYYLAR